jgi:hypothetical protein
MVTILRPLSTSELLDRTFHLYRNNFALFVGIAALPQIGVAGAELFLVEKSVHVRALGRWDVVLITFALNFLALQIAHAATATAVGRLNTNKPASISTAYSEAKGSLLRVIWIAFVAFILPFLVAIPLTLTAVGIMTVLILGTGETGNAAAVIIALTVLTAIFALPMRWWLRWSLVVPITVIEGGGLRASMRRSKALTNDRRGRIFIAYVLILVLTWVVKAVCQAPFYIVLGMRSFRHPRSAYEVARLVQLGGSFISACLVGALLTITITLIYYDERVRREGLDLQLMMAAAEASAATNAIASPA